MGRGGNRGKQIESGIAGKELVARDEWAEGTEKLSP